MTLDPSCLEYPNRRRGMDHDLYDWSCILDRNVPAWPSGKPVAAAVLVSLEWFPILPEDNPFRAPGHMQTAYPDYRHYTSREYGTRVGFYRFLDAFNSHGVKASIAVNSAIAERYPSIISDIVSEGHEIIAHGRDMNDVIATGIAEDEERRIIDESLETLERISGTRPRGWMSIARSQSFNTPGLLKAAGIEYMCDWVNDDLPYAFRSGFGEILSIPYNHELSDRQIITVQQHSAESYVEQMKDACDWLASEKVPRILPLHVTPYILGLPYRMAAFEELLGWLSKREDTEFLTASGLAMPYLS